MNKERKQLEKLKNLLESQYIWAHLYPDFDFEQPIRQLVQAGADVNLRISFDRTPLIVAAGNNNPRIVQIFLNAGANINLQSFFGSTALRHTSDPEIVAMLLKAGADVNDQNAVGEAALTNIAKLNPRSTAQNRLVISEMFLAAGANVNHQDNSHETALFFAARLNRPELMPVLLGAGADLTIRNNAGQTALDVARVHNNTQIIELLSKYKIR